MEQTGYFIIPIAAMQFPSENLVGFLLYKVQLRDLANFSFFLFLGHPIFRYEAKYIRCPILLLLSSTHDHVRVLFHHPSSLHKCLNIDNVRNYG